MLFNSAEFLIFFPIVTLVYFLIPQKVKWVWLLLASYYFYMCWNPKYALLMAASTVITYLSGALIAKANKNPDKKHAARAKKLTVAASFLSNLGILVFFKYSGFLTDSVNALLHFFGKSAVMPQFDVVLPVGISFYTFQALSYTMDVYRGEIQAEKNPFRYALFVSFFPQLVAGPIERSKNLLIQLHEEHHFSFIRAKRGLLLMLWGFFEKLVIADRAAILVNQVYNHHTDYGGLELALATVLFALQIYCDFSSYTDIARGAAEVMGFSLMKNFEEPYFAKTIAQFWRDWHISLSGWFRDYLYIPLGGNKRGQARKYFNIMVVFLASGLWHGANWTFVIWGLLHGIYQVAGGMTLSARKQLSNLFRIDRNTHAYHLFQRAITFLLVCFGWIFFRANSVSDAFGIVRKIFCKWDPWILSGGGLTALGLSGADLNILIFGAAVLFCVSAAHYYHIQLRNTFLKNHLVFRWAFLFAAIFFILIFGIYGPGFEESQFIYFQF